MNIKAVLKENPVLRRLGKSVNIHKQFSTDAKNFSKYYVEEAERKGDYRYSIMLYSGERQQGLFNAGLCTMSFVNGLHTKGIGSCCLQWSNKDNEDALIREKMHLSESERIAVVVGAGYYLEENVIPCSVRKSTDDIFSVV